MDKLFDAFYTTKSGGMGIGLSVSRPMDLAGSRSSRPAPSPTFRAGTS
jgi:C4-dicarboxylate-specific signal transduction histidine kinase